MAIVAENVFAADAPSLLTRRGLFATLPALALAGRTPTADPHRLVADLEAALARQRLNFRRGGRAKDRADAALDRPEALKVHRRWEAVGDEDAARVEAAQAALVALVCRASGRGLAPASGEDWDQGVWPTLAARVGPDLWVVGQNPNSDDADPQLFRLPLADVADLGPEGGAGC